MSTILKIFLFLAFATPALSQTLMSMRVGSVDGFLALLSPDCKKIYYFPQTYNVLPAGSSVYYDRTVTQDGAFETVQPAIVAKLELSPVETAPTAADEADLISWASAGTSCHGSKIQFERYPTMLVQPDIDSPLFVKQTAELEPNSTIDLTYKVNPFIINQSSLLSLLHQWRLMLNVKAFSVKTEATATLNVEYSAIAHFLQHSFTTQVCVRRQSCVVDLFGVQIACYPETDCSDTEHLITTFNGMNLNTNISMHSELGEDVPIYVLHRLEGELLSNLIVDSFTTKTRQDLNGITQITPGVLRKNLSGRYEKSVSLRVPIAQIFNWPVYTGDPASLLGKEINEVYKTRELVCLMSQKRPIMINNDCFH